MTQLVSSRFVGSSKLVNISKVNNLFHHTVCLRTKSVSIIQNYFKKIKLLQKNKTVARTEGTVRMENIIVGFEYFRKIKHNLDGSKPSHEVQGRSTKKLGQQVFLMVRTLKVPPKTMLNLHEAAEEL